ELPNQVPEAIKHQRREQLMLAQQSISFRRNQAQIGRTVDVLVEQANAATGESIGRSARFAPDVDGLVYIQGLSPLGRIVPVTIEAADTYDLYGSLAAVKSAPAPVSVSLV
ncbi:MAG: TRAM domain-containing protein, partial [Cyanobacteria bacterium P01_D01_bin.44]